MRHLDENTMLSVVAPVYNESENIESFINETRAAVLALNLPGRREFILVDDGSTDGSGEKLDAAAERHPGEIHVIHLARNFGVEAAIAAGLDHARGDAVIVMDSDQQDDPAVFPALIEQWRNGFDVVYAVRKSRKESWLRRTAFWAFYRMMAWVTQTRLPLDAGNFALMDRRVVELLRRMPERNRFMRGLRAWVGFKQTGVPVNRRARYGNKTRLGVRGQWRCASDALFSFSYVPLFVLRVVGVLAILTSGALIAYALYAKLLTDMTLKAWTSQLITTSFFGGINLFAIGLLGEYIARIYDEVKARPMYVVSRMVGPEQKADRP